MSRNIRKIPQCGRQASAPDMSIGTLPGIKSAVTEAIQTAGQGFENLRLLAGVDALSTMMEEDAGELAGEAHERDAGKPIRRWGRAKGRAGFHGGKAGIGRPPGSLEGRGSGDAAARPAGGGRGRLA